jgi:hypothetical protein
VTKARLQTGAAILGLALTGVLAAAFVFSNGWTLYYGDAEAHLNIARRMFDSRTPGYLQIGTVWLPLPHFLMLPFAASDSLWRSGLAGVIPSVLCFIAAGGFLFGAARRLFESALAAFVCIAVFALNPNVLYLSSIPMTEPVFFAALFGLLWAILRFRESPALKWAAAGGVAALAASLTRYEGWFFLPFAALFFLFAGKSRHWRAVFLFGGIAAAGPLWWLAHNFYCFGNALEFYNGPYSAMAIYQRALDAGMARYPGDHDFPKAAQYFAVAVQTAAGRGLLLVSGLGALWVLRKRRFPALLFLLLPPVFYLWSMYSSQVPIFVPSLWPFSYYNTRYALAAFPFLVCCAGALTLAAPVRYRAAAATAIVAAATLPWLIRAPKERQEISICWKESRANSVSRREWTREAAAILKSQYRPGSGIILSFGDLMGILREAGIPQRESLHEGNPAAWNAATSIPRYFLHEEWAVAISGDRVATAIVRSRRTGPRYRPVAVIAVKGAPVIEIYRRD